MQNDGDFANMQEGEIRDVYDRPEGFWGRMFQRPDRTAIKIKDRIDIYNKKPGVFGRFFQRPDKTIKIRPASD
ncbi:MAG: hypothetical protein ACE5FY_00030 [Nitrospiria bacterium]